MRKIKEVLRLKLEAKLSHAQIAAALGISKGVVTKYVGLATITGLDWSAIQSFDETTLERQLLAAEPTIRRFKLSQKGISRCLQRKRTI